MDVCRPLPLLFLPAPLFWRLFSSAYVFSPPPKKNEIGLLFRKCYFIGKLQYTLSVLIFCDIVIRVDVDNIRMEPMHPAGFLVEGCTNYSVDGGGGHFILFWEAAVTVIFQSFLDNGPFFSDDRPRLICNLRGSRQLLTVLGVRKAGLPQGSALH